MGDCPFLGVSGCLWASMPCCSDLVLVELMALTDRYGRAWRYLVTPAGFWFISLFFPQNPQECGMPVFRRGFWALICLVFTLLVFSVITPLLSLGCRPVFGSTARPPELMAGSWPSRRSGCHLLPQCTTAFLISPVCHIIEELLGLCRRAIVRHRY